MAHNDGTMGVAKDNLGSHLNEFIDEEEPALEHFLMDEDTALGLGGHYKQDAQEVGGKSGPRCIAEGHERAVDEGVDFVMLLSGDIEVITPFLNAYPQTTEGFGNNAQVGHADTADGQPVATHGAHTDERPHLNHIWEQTMPCSMKRGRTDDGQQVGGNAGNLCPHGIEQMTKLLDIGLAGSIVDGGGSFSQYGGHNDVGRSCHRGFVK